MLPSACVRVSAPTTLAISGLRTHGPFCPLSTLRDHGYPCITQDSLPVRWLGFDRTGLFRQARLPSFREPPPPVGAGFPGAQHIRFHPRILDLAGHYHFAPKPCAVARGNEKGRVERKVGFLRHSFFAARAFSSVADLNAQLARWIAAVAHARPVPGRPEQTVAAALAEEHPRLLPLPEHAFSCELVRPVASGKTPYVRFDANDYSIPHVLLRRPLTLIASEAHVRLVDGTTEVARHARSYDRGQRIEDPAHLAALVQEKRRAHALRGRDRLRSACAHADAFLDALARRDAPLGIETVRLLRLLDQVGPAALEGALAAALERQAVSAASVAHLLEQQRRARRLPPPVEVILPADPRVRDLRVTPHALSAYDTLLTPIPPREEEAPDDPTG